MNQNTKPTIPFQHTRFNLREEEDGHKARIPARTCLHSLSVARVLLRLTPENGAFSLGATTRVTRRSFSGPVLLELGLCVEDPSKLGLSRR
ncbi:hypothetical protein PanWU01x14_282180 [Parasponia andersonii]|uniref:Uncharacterized protein n=1 Tax=Parasponia andersonii TaxID=3476 RepID=A0A2P5B0X5_PARAD|nr:hypothetical protein PanWU01x14_282180 [Parasponia andersonii]